MDEIITFIITLTAMTIGYMVGKGKTVDIPTVAENIRKKIISTTGPKPGPLHRPTIKQIDRKKNKKYYEGVDEVKKAFEQLGVKENG